MAVLLPNRKLKFLEQQPLASLLPAGTTSIPASLQGPGCLTKDADRTLLYWFVEDSVKRRYTLFVTSLEELSKDSLDFLKEKATKAMADLLSKKPEAEAK